MLNTIPSVIGRHMAHIISPKGCAVAVDEVAPMAFMAIPDAISSYATEPITDSLSQAYGMPMTATRVTSPVTIAMDGTMAKVIDDLTTSFIVASLTPHSRACL